MQLLKEEKEGKRQSPKLYLPWNLLVLVYIQIKDASISDKQPLNTQIEKSCDEKSRLDSHRLEQHTINTETYSNKKNKSCVSGRFIPNTTNSKSNSFYQNSKTQLKSPRLGGVWKQNVDMKQEQGIEFKMAVVGVMVSYWERVQYFNLR